jgi:acetoin utilization protein AcuB
MSTPVLTFTRGEPASDAFAQMRDAQIRHGVVLSGTDVVGVLSDRDLGGPRGGLARKGCTVADLMHAEPIVMAPDVDVTKAAIRMRRARIGCVPIVEHEKLVGIVTRGDLLEALAQGRRAKRAIPLRTPDAPHPPHLVSPNRDKWP